MFGKAFHVKTREVNTSLIEEFKYPKLGPGQLWEVVAARVEAMGGTILNSKTRRSWVWKSGAIASRR